MSLIVEVVKNIVFIAFFSLLMEIFLPEGNIKKYAHLVMGLILIMIIVNPVLSLKDEDFNIFIDEKYKTEDIVEAGIDLNGEIEKSLVKSGQKDLNRQIRALILTNNDIKDAKVYCEIAQGKIEKIEIMLKVKEELEEYDLIENRINELISTFFSVDENKIFIKEEESFDN